MTIWSVDNASNNYQGATMRLVVGGACVIVLICDSTQFTHRYSMEVQYATI